MSLFHLAQINVGTMLAPKGDPQVQPFFDAIDRINAVADAAPGFVWRLKDEAGDATALKPTTDPLLLINMSVWEEIESLFTFTYQSAHTPVMAQRRAWFARFEGAHQALWWVPLGHRPTVEEGFAKLWHLDRYGPSAYAFTFKARFPAPQTRAA